MKIAILTSEYITEANWHGGLANYLNRIVRGLKNKGHDIHIFVYSDKQQIANKYGVTIHRIFFNEKHLWGFNILTFKVMPGFALMMYVAIKFRKYFLEISKKEKYDIVHSASCQTPALLLNSKIIGIPIITRLSSVMRLCQVAYNRKNKLDMFLINQAEKFLIKKSDKVFAPSRLVQKKVMEEFGAKIDVIESPEYFRNIKKFDNSVYEKYLKNKKYILFYGTLGRLKGSEFIANVIYDFLSKNNDCFFVIIGKMEILKKRELPIESILKNAKEFRDKIYYFNSLGHIWLFPIIKNAKAILLPSMIDNLPNTCIESMGLGKIVIGTYEGGFDQLIDDGRNGFLVKYGDNKKLCETLDKICRGNERDFRQIEKAAKKTTNERLNFDNKITELEEYYEQAIKDFKKK